MTDTQVTIYRKIPLKNAEKKEAVKLLQLRSLKMNCHQFHKDTKGQGNSVREGVDCAARTN